MIERDSLALAAGEGRLSATSYKGGGIASFAIRYSPGGGTRGNILVRVKPLGDPEDSQGVDHDLGVNEARLASDQKTLLTSVAQLPRHTHPS